MRKYSLSSGESATLVNNAGDALTLTQSGSFTFTAIPFYDSAYDDTVQTQRPASCARSPMTPAGGTHGYGTVFQVS